MLLTSGSQRVCCGKLTGAPQDVPCGLFLAVLGAAIMDHTRSFAIQVGDSQESLEEVFRNCCSRAQCSFFVLVLHLLLEVNNVFDMLISVLLREFPAVIVVH